MWGGVPGRTDERDGNIEKRVKSEVGLEEEEAAAFDRCSICHSPFRATPRVKRARVKQLNGIKNRLFQDTLRHVEFLPELGSCDVATHPFSR